MKFEKKNIPYLTDEAFSNGLKVKVSGQNTNLNRVELIQKLFIGKKVIHLGCADHIPLIEKKIASSEWLHGEIEKVAENLIGLDINEKAIQFLLDIDIRNIYSTDIIKDDVITEVKVRRWDYLFLGEMVEHVDDPVFFLRKLNEKYKNHVDSVVVTVPNAFRLANFKHSISGKELINSDHRYWFTPYTIAKVLVQAGLVVGDYYLIDAFSSSSPLQSIRHKLFPMFSDTIVMIAKLKND